MKRFFDVSLILLSPPLLAVAALLVRVKLGAPVLFKQVRPYPLGHKGLAGKPFTMMKFRSMTDERDDRGKCTL